ncbi:MAG: hypothetical protein WD038_10520 [Balneolales bacterium]
MTKAASISIALEYRKLFIKNRLIKGTIKKPILKKAYIPKHREQTALGIPCT